MAAAKEQYLTLSESISFCARPVSTPIFLIVDFIVNISYNDCGNTSKSLVVLLPQSCIGRSVTFRGYCPVNLTVVWRGRTGARCTRLTTKGRGMALTMKPSFLPARADRQIIRWGRPKDTTGA